MLARINSLVMSIFDSHKFENSILLLIEYFAAIDENSFLLLIRFIAAINKNCSDFLHALPIRRICAPEKSRCSD